MSSPRKDNKKRLSVTWKRVPSVSVPGECTGNDFLRQEEEIEGPLRRFGLNAVSLLRHVPKQVLEDLCSRLGGATSVNGCGKVVTLKHFIELLAPVIGTASGFFDSEGKRVEEKWIAEGWLSTATRAAEWYQRKASITRRIAREDAIPTKTSPTTPVAPFVLHPKSDLEEYLRDVFLLVDTHRQGYITWDQFTMFLIEGISDVKSSKAVPEASVTGDRLEDAASYVFAGEVPIFYATVQSTTSHEWFSKIKYVESIGRVMCVSRRRIAFVSPTATTQRAGAARGAGTLRDAPTTDEDTPTMTIDARGAITAVEYLSCYDATLVCALTLEDDPMTLWQHSPCGLPQEVLRCGKAEFSSSSITALLWMNAERKLWVGTRKGEVFTLEVLKDVTRGKYFLQNLRRLDSHKDTVTTFFLHPQTNNVFSASMDSTVKLHSPVDAMQRGEQACLATLASHHHGVLCIEYSSEYHVALTGGFDDAVLLWADNLWNDPVGRFEDNAKPFRGAVMGIRCITNTPFVGVSDTSGAFKLFDVRKHTLVLARCVTDSENIWRGLLKREHIRRYEPEVFVPPTTQERSVASTAAGTSVVKDRYSTLFSSMEFTGHETRQFWFGGSRVYAFCLSSAMHENPLLTYDTDKTLVAASIVEGLGILTASCEECTLWSMQTGLSDCRLRRMTRTEIVCVSYRVGGEVMVLGHTGGCISAHSITTGIQLQEYQGHEDDVTALGLHPCDPTLISVSRKENKLCIFHDKVLLDPHAKPYVQTQCGRNVAKQISSLPSPATNVTFHDNGTTFAVGTHTCFMLFTYCASYHRWTCALRVAHPSAQGELQRCVFVPSCAAEPASEQTLLSSVLLVADSRGQLTLWSVTLNLQSPDDSCATAIRAWSNATSNLSNVKNVLRTASTQIAPLSPRDSQDGQHNNAAFTDEQSAAVPLRCCVFDSVCPSLLYTGDDMGQIGVWWVAPQQGFTRCPPTELLKTFQAHPQPLLEIVSVARPIHAIISCGLNNCVCLWGWDGTALGILQQGPVALRVWKLTSALASVPNLRSHVRWLRLRCRVLDGTYEESNSEHPESPGSTLLPNVGASGTRNRSNLFAEPQSTTMVSVTKSWRSQFGATRSSRSESTVADGSAPPRQPHRVPLPRSLAPLPPLNKSVSQAPAPVGARMPAKTVVEALLQGEEDLLPSKRLDALGTEQKIPTSIVDRAKRREKQREDEHRLQLQRETDARDRFDRAIKKLAATPQPLPPRSTKRQRKGSPRVLSPSQS